MYNRPMASCEPMKFKRFSHKGYALFACLGKVVLIGTLSVATVSHAKAEGVSTKELRPDTLSTQSDVMLNEVSVTLTCAADQKSGGENGNCTGQQGNSMCASAKC